MKISKIIEKNKNSIILLDLVIPEGGNRAKISVRGTGLIISQDGKFVTCAHVYKQIPENELSYLGVKVAGRIDEKGITHYDRYKIKLLEMDNENDVALMQIISDRNDFKAIKHFGTSKLIREGEEVIFIGYPLATDLLRLKFGITMTTNKCIIGSVKHRRMDGSLYFFMVDTHTNNGSSGSPVFSSDTGKMIGIVSGKISSKIPVPNGRFFDIPANLGLCRPIKYIVDLIEKNKRLIG